MSTFPDDLKTAVIGDTPLAYVERGSGEPVVFVHGTSQDMRTWRAQLDPIATEHRAIVYSRRYARPNTDIPPGQDDPMSQHVDDLAALLRAVDANPAHLVGNSWGAFICLLLAIREPAMVRTLTLCEAPVVPLFVPDKPGPGDLARLLLRGPVTATRILRFGLGVVEPAKKALLAGDEERAQRIFGTAVLGEERYAALPPERRQMFEDNAAAEHAQLIGSPLPPLRAADVRRVQAPVLLITGAESPPILRETLTGELQRLLPHAERATIPAASHLMHEDNPQAFNDALLAFLRRAHTHAAPQAVGG